MLGCKETSLPASTITKISALLPPPSAPSAPAANDKYALATEALTLWIRAIVTTHGATSSPSYSQPIIEHIKNLDSQEGERECTTIVQHYLSRSLCFYP